MKSYMVNNTVKRLPEMDWDVLIILDACRYDMFKECYPKSSVKKAFTPAFTTQDYLIRMFSDYKMMDTIYISANPYVNGKHYPVRFHRKTFDALDHFSRVVDVWDSDFDEEYGTVLPQSVTKHALALMDLYPDKRFIVHYIQPHTPYLYYKAGGVLPCGPMNGQFHVNMFTGLNGLRQFIPDVLIWCCAGLFGKLPGNGLGQLWGKVGTSGLIYGYKQDLMLTVSNVFSLIHRFPGKRFLVTGDHGELLGEHGRFGHYKDCHLECQHLVPWLTVG